MAPRKLLSHTVSEPWDVPYIPRMGTEVRNSIVANFTSAVKVVVLKSVTRPTRKTGCCSRVYADLNREFTILKDGGGRGLSEVGGSQELIKPGYLH